MLLGVITNCMTFFNNLLVNMGVLVYILSYAKEGGLGIVSFKKPKYPRGYLGYWAIIKG